jgi:Zn-dependent protease with chaperone function
MYQHLMGLVALATFAAVSTAAAMGLALSWRWLEAPRTHGPAVARARLLLLLRLAPVVLGVLACGMTMLAFARHEPRTTVETPGWILLTGASIGVGLAVVGLWRIMVHWRTTSRFLQTVERTATRITLPGVSLPTWQLETAFPLVALAGIWRPSLLVARGILEQVPGDELQVIVKHELAHARQRDNVARLLLTGLPDVLSLGQKWLGVERAWQEASEDAADELATGDDAQARVCLASALVRVARMVGSRAMPAVPLLAFHRGGSVERRVRRLLVSVEPRASAPSHPLVFMTLTLSSSGALAWWLTANVVLLRVHQAIEWLVNTRL